MITFAASMNEFYTHIIFVSASGLVRRCR